MNKSGRPSDPYPREDFVALLRREMLKKFGGIGVLALARMAGVDKSTLWNVIHTGRPCTTDHRRKLMNALEVPAAEAERFLPPKGNNDTGELILMDTHPGASHPLLDRGQDHLVRAQYDLAKRDFTSVYRAGGNAKLHVLEADAAMRLAWVQFEQGLTGPCDKWINLSLDAIIKHFGPKVTVKHIVESVKHGSSSAMCSYGDEASHVLSRALHLRSKMLVEEIVYKRRDDLVPRALQAFDLSIALDEFIGDKLQLGHDYRWMAVLQASRTLKNERLSASFLEKAGNMFPVNSLGRAYLARDKGVVNYLENADFRPTREQLVNGSHELASFFDARAMGPNLCVLSKLLEKRYRSDGTDRQYALAAAVLDPYSFVLDNAVRIYAYADKRCFSKDMENLRQGKGPFADIHRVMARLTSNEDRTASERIDENLSLIRTAISSRI